MKRREFITLLGGAAAAWPLAARAQQATKHYRIGMLETTSPTANAANLNAFRQRLQELGYVEGRNLVIDYRSAEGRKAPSTCQRPSARLPANAPSRG
jgi:putative ABC transport system substrate-binding protein